MSESASDETRRQIKETREIWEAKAGFWDDYIGPDGNEFHRELVAPTQRRLLELRPGETVLDIACGNGQFTREMAQVAGRVVACDISATFLERARKHTASAGIANVEYQQVDATDEAALRALDRGPFDAAVCTMALMDIPVIEPLMRAVHDLLRSGGRFVFSVMHPCFNQSGALMVEELEDRDGSLVPTYALKVVGYSTPSARKGVGIRGEPAPHYYFHRPLAVLLGACFAAGLVVDALEEAAFAGEAADRRSFDWRNYREMPQVLAVRARKVAG